MPASRPSVLLTGVTGFVGAHVLDRLIDSDKYRIIAPVRSLNKVQHLRTKYHDQIDSEQLTFVEIPDLSVPHAFDSALKEYEVAYIIHLASPYFVTTTNPMEELVKPAVSAAHNVMESAITLGYTYTEEDWDPVTEEEAAQNGFLGYHASKTFAEREAWKMHAAGSDHSKAQRAGFDLVTVCPPMIYGPPLQFSPEHPPKGGIEGLNTSTARLINGITGRDPKFAPLVANPVLPAWIDVRDVARALVASLKLPPGTSERILLCGGVAYYEDGLEELRARGVAGLGEPGARCDPTKYFALDQTKMRKLLWIEKTVPFTKTVTDTYDAVKGLGLL